MTCPCQLAARAYVAQGPTVLEALRGAMRPSSVKSYAECCRPYHLDSRAATTPEALTRARYSATALKNYSFLMDTTDESSPSHTVDRQTWSKDMIRAFRDVNFVGFSYDRTEALGEEDGEPLRGVLFYYAVDKANPFDLPLVLIRRERAVYRCRGGQWRYARSEILREEVVEGACNPVRAAVLDVLNAMF